MTSGNNASGKADILTLKGDLTIFRAAAIRLLLKESLHVSDEVHVILQEVTRVDLSCLQLLCSAHRTAAAAGKIMTLETPVPDILRKLMHQAGFRRQKACAFSPSTNCPCFDGGY